LFICHEILEAHRRLDLKRKSLKRVPVPSLEKNSLALSSSHQNVQVPSKNRRPFSVISSQANIDFVIANLEEENLQLEKLKKKSIREKAKFEKETKIKNARVLVNAISAISMKKL